MAVLPVELRNQLDRTIVEAREVAEAGAKTALEALAVHHHEPYGHMSPDERKLRNHLRARARLLGDKQNRKGQLEISHLIWQCAYEHWQRMLFARFLAENNLLIEPEMGVAISLEECDELAKEEGKDLWTLASHFAQGMLPQIFRTNDPILKVTFAMEHRIKLEQLLDDLEPTIFTASDSLGWVYQFWQTKRKKQINESEDKIGADELPAVTQLFTEPYMVEFLIHNTIGSWWAGKLLAERPDLAFNSKTEEELRKAVAVPGITWDYLRFTRTDDGKGIWRPASGSFEEWPKSVGELKILDPSCGSGHFLVTLLYHLVPLLIIEKDLTPNDAIDYALQNNLCGLEIDERCTQLAAFALALVSWTYPKLRGYRTLPRIQIACSGIAPNTKREEWLRLAEENSRARNSMSYIYDLFKQAPILGSLINLHTEMDEPLFKAGFKDLHPILEDTVLKDSDDLTRRELGISALSITDAIKILLKQYHLVITNVPYLVRGKQEASLKRYLEKYHDKAKQDLATAFIERSLEFCSNGGSIALVNPQNWLFLRTYKNLRVRLLKENTWNIVAKLGPGAFETISGEVVNVNLLSITKAWPEEDHCIAGLDANSPRIPKEKEVILRGTAPNLEEEQRLIIVEQREQLNNPDARITLITYKGDYLENHANCYAGIQSGDFPRFGKYFWELSKMTYEWEFLQSTVDNTNDFSGRKNILFWENGEGVLVNEPFSYVRGLSAHGKKGIAVSQMNKLPVTLYTGELFDNNTAIIIPHEPDNLRAIWGFCISKEFNKAVRKMDQKMNVTNATLVKIPFDLIKWKKCVYDKYRNGLPKPFSDDPTQWIFHGYPAQSTEALQVAVVRLLGYRWPTEQDDGIELADEQWEWVKKCDGLLKCVAEDGIVCIPSVRGEETAAGRLRALLTAALGLNWSSSTEQELLRVTGANATNLDEWLCNHFFEQHCKLFHHRPFIWHIWDGRRRDGFHALVNYHKLSEGNGKGRQLLENLTYSYLGDWIIRQKEGVKLGEGGAEDRLAAALELQKRLIAIIEGEPPFDIFVRWKPIEKQPIGWEPVINDGVRLNIRPFMAQDISGGRKGAGILRWKPNIKWGKDRGKEPYRPKEQYPWFWNVEEFTGDRVNDIHLSIDEKSKARAKT